MTQREFFERVVNTTAEEELREKATELLEKLDKKNASRASKPSKTQLANEPIKSAILEYLEGDKIQTAAEIAEALDISTQKASALARQLTEENKVVQSEVKLPKKGKVKAYSLATAE